MSKREVRKKLKKIRNEHIVTLIHLFTHLALSAFSNKFVYFSSKRASNTSKYIFKWKYDETFLTVVSTIA